MKFNRLTILIIAGIALLLVIFFVLIFHGQSTIPTQVNHSQPFQPSQISQFFPELNNTNTGSTATQNTSGSTTNNNNTSNNKNVVPAATQPQYVPGTAFAVPAQGASKMNLYAEDNTKIPVNNLYNNPVQKLPNNAVVFIEKDDYQEAFYPKTQYFLIVLFNPDLQKARDEAESDFLKTLGITKDQACKLNVQLGAPIWVNPNIHVGTTNYGLSFCPNGKSLPTS